MVSTGDSRWSHGSFIAGLPLFLPLLAFAPAAALGVQMHAQL